MKKKKGKQKMNNQDILKHDLLKNLYLLEDSFDIFDLNDCQNLLIFLSTFLENKEIDEDIKLSVKNILIKGKQQFEENQKCCCCFPQKEYINDNDFNIPYQDHSLAFKTLLSRRIYAPPNPDYDFGKK